MVQLSDGGALRALAVGGARRGHARRLAHAPRGARGGGAEPVSSPARGVGDARVARRGLSRVPGIGLEAPGLAFSGVLGDEAHPVWGVLPSVGAYFSARRENEVVFFHRASRTMVCADALLNLSTHASPVAARARSRASRNSSPGAGWPERLMVRDRRVARRQIDRILRRGTSWHRAGAQHAHTVLGDGRETVRRAYAWVPAHVAGPMGCRAHPRRRSMCAMRSIARRVLVLLGVGLSARGLGVRGPGVHRRRLLRPMPRRHRVGRPRDGSTPRLPQPHRQSHLSDERLAPALRPAVHPLAHQIAECSATRRAHVHRRAPARRWSIQCCTDGQPAELHGVRLRRRRDAGEAPRHTGDTLDWRWLQNVRVRSDGVTTRLTHVAHTGAGHRPGGRGYTAPWRSGLSSTCRARRTGVAAFPVTDHAQNSGLRRSSTRLSPPRPSRWASSVTARPRTPDDGTAPRLCAEFLRGWTNNPGPSMGTVDDITVHPLTGRPRCYGRGGRLGLHHHRVVAALRGRVSLRRRGARQRRQPRRAMRVSHSNEDEFDAVAGLNEDNTAVAAEVDAARPRRFSRRVVRRPRLRRRPRGEPRRRRALRRRARPELRRRRAHVPMATTCVGGCACRAAWRARATHRRLHLRARRRRRGASSIPRRGARGGELPRGSGVRPPWVPGPVRRRDSVPRRSGVPRGRVR